MFRCTNCGHIFDEGEQLSYKEYVGEFHGMPAYDDFSVCPICKGDYEEIKPCKICGGYSHNSNEEFCDDCRKSVKQRFDKIIEIFTDEEKELLQMLWEDEEIL